MPNILPLMIASPSCQNRSLEPARFHLLQGSPSASNIVEVQVSHLCMDLTSNTSILRATVLR